MILSAADYDPTATELCERALVTVIGGAGWCGQHLKATMRPPDGGWDLGSVPWFGASLADAHYAQRC